MIEREQTLMHERQRLMRDMHDGVGSSLMSALRLVEHGEAALVDVPQVLRECIDDLKISIDSLEPVDADLLALLKSGTDARVQFLVNALRVRFQAKLTDGAERKAFVTLLARFVKSFHFLTCFFTYSAEIREFVTFAEWVGPQLIKAGTVSELMKQIRATVVTKAAVQYQGVTTSSGPVKLQPGKGKGGAGLAPVKASVQDVIAQIRTRFDITDEEALYIKQVTDEKIADPVIRTTVRAHRDNVIYLDGPYRGQVNGDIQTTYDRRGRYDELADPKYTDAGGIFDIMAVTVIQTHLAEVA